jgi:hypothetical protein
MQEPDLHLVVHRACRRSRPAAWTHRREVPKFPEAAADSKSTKVPRRKVSPILSCRSPIRPARSNVPWTIPIRGLPCTHGSLDGVPEVTETRHCATLFGPSHGTSCNHICWGTTRRGKLSVNRDRDRLLTTRHVAYTVQLTTSRRGERVVVEFSSGLPGYTGRTTSRVCDCVGGAHALKMEHSSCESRFLRVGPA